VEQRVPEVLHDGDQGLIRCGRRTAPAIIVGAFHLQPRARLEHDVAGRNVSCCAASVIDAQSRPTGGGWEWPTDKLTALRLGQRLVTEVLASRSDRRAFVDITPTATPADVEASRQGWKRADHARTFTLQHRDYEADRLDGYDYDIGAVLVKATTVVSEVELTAVLGEWGLHPERFVYPWQSDDPK